MLSETLLVVLKKMNQEKMMLWVLLKVLVDLFVEVLARAVLARALLARALAPDLKEEEEEEKEQVLALGLEKV